MEFLCCEFELPLSCHQGLSRNTHLVIKDLA